MIELTPFEAARQIRLLSIWLQQANFSIDLPPSANALQQRIGDRLKLAESTGLEPATSAVTGRGFYEGGLTIYAKFTPDFGCCENFGTMQSTNLT